ncbi:type I restriction-modification system endonuclease [Limosilactobacillus equigenerosi]|uniref:type I restriction-modification system endonuclease n=1 Tax=Limosilactobacillus equigenerosi TaxID=417373 RepID=UPI0021E81ADA|nr:type I restriction-modification system endonuclease [Limosilactobacillus equigenerosi]
MAMATGTGKTRTAISLMYRLLKHKRARRILYLVDRQSLATQTNNALTDNRIEQQSISSIFGVKTFEEILPEMTTKIQIATVQGMVKRLFHNGETEITPGMYDFVIVDEAHRGYFEDKEMTDDEMEFYDHNDYVSQYRRVVDYFDAVAIGMTATPTLNTIKIFGNPVYSYSYRQAVLDGYLMDHDAPIILETEQSQNGLHFKKGAEVTVFDYDSHQVDTDVLSDDIDFEVDDFNIKVDNTGFNREIASYLTKQLDPNDPELGKTLIFATRDSHADKIVSLLNEAFEAADNPVPINAIMKITGKDRHREDHIKQFNNEQFPNIVVTVDLLTTGIDIPSITNLVFLRRVKSRVLFEQMLGRATRLCPDVEVDHFKIYDAVGQYKAMKSFTAMNQVIQSKNINRSIKELYELAVGATSEDAYHEYLEQLTAKLQRKCSRLSSEQINELEDGLQIPDLLGWVRNLQTLTLGELSQFEEEINVLNDYRVMKRRVIVSYDEDQVVSDKPGFGNDGVTTSSDYLEEFNQFVQHAVNEKVGIYVTAKSRPRDLKLQDLQEIERVLVFKGFNETDLQKAWKQEHHQNTAANIISFIRQAALGTPLQDEDELISRAMKKVYNLADWNDKQKKWLRRIESQLRENNVLGPTAKMAFNDNDIFREKGGYNRINKDLDGKADEIINLINDVMFG